MTTRYEVRFTLKRRAHDLGHAVEFHHLRPARGFSEALSDNIGNLVQGWCWEGFLVSVDGVFEITELRVQ